MTKSRSTPPAARFPEASDSLRLEKLDQVVAVKGYGKLKTRAIRPNDEKGMVHFHQSISEESIYMRYFEYLGLDQRTSHERLIRICTNTPESYAIVVEEVAVTSSYPATILAVGRLTTTAEPYVVSFDKLTVDEEDPPQLGKVLLHRLIKLAQVFGFQILACDLLVADHDTLTLCRTLGFSVQTLPEGGLVRVTLAL